MSREIHLETLIGRIVRDPQGRRVGRIVEMEASRHDGHWIITHFLLGPSAAWARMSPFRAHRDARARIGWMGLDLSDPARPRLRERAGPD